MSQPYALKGGLDLSTSKAMVNPGTLQDCLNYEVSDVDGYSRISGFERFDGQFRVAGAQPLRLRGTATTGTFYPGDPIQLNGVPGYVTAVVSQSPWVVCVLLNDTLTWPLAFPVDLVHATGDASASVTSAELLRTPVGAQKTVNAARKQMAAALRPQVGPVPGNPATPVACVFWYKNRLYAIRDYPLLWFESEKQYPFAVGNVVAVNGGAYQIIAIHYVANTYLAGYMVLWPISQTGALMTVAPLPGDTVSRSGAYTGFDAGGAALGELPVAMMGTVGFGDSKATVTNSTASPQAETDDLSARAYRTPAGLWKATTSGWQPVDLKREAQFRAGTAGFGTFVASNIGIGAQVVLSSGYLAGGLALMNGADVTAAAAADDGTDVALSSASTDELLVTGPDMSSVPDTSTILGIEVRIKRHADIGGKVRDDIVELVGLDGASANKARTTAWDATATEVVYGSANDTWGNDNITAAAVKAAKFGVRLTTKAIDATPTGGIDAVAINVYYRRRDASVFAWDGTADIPLNLIDVQMISGTYVDGDAAGWLVVDVPDGGLGSSVSNGMELHTAPGGAGTLLCTLASSDQFIRLPGWLDLQANQSQYRTIVTNYYGQSSYEAVYGVSGASPAWTYDGSRLLWIRTPIDPQQDMPRHIARHGSSLVLGYLPGAYALSQVGNPVNFRGEDGAASIEIGERLTNLMPAMGDALLVTGQNKTKVLHGLTPDTYQQDTVSDKRGALEYSGADVGRLLITDTFGVAAADATQAFGDLARSYLSMKVRAWLSQRLSAGTASDQRPICAMAVGGKNQYRLFFRDGYYLTMTASDVPEFMLQRYFLPAAGIEDADQPFPVAAITTGIDGEGRERVFGTFDADANRGYVFELDHGNTFDGQPVPAYVVLNPLSFSDSVQLKRFEHLLVFGAVDGYAKLQLSRAIGYDVPDGSQAASFSLGDPLAVAGPQRAARGTADAPVEAYEISIRVDSSTDEEGPHTLQAVATDFDSRGDTRGHVRG